MNKFRRATRLYLPILGLLLGWDVVCQFWVQRMDWNTLPGWVIRWSGTTHYPHLPGWFVGLTLAAMIVATFLSFVLYLSTDNGPNASTGSIYKDSALCILFSLTFVATSSVHQIRPFLFPWIGLWRDFTFIDVVGFIITWIGFLGGLVAAWLVTRGRRQNAMIVVGIIGWLCLIPADHCFNEFNYAWLARLGASPLMFLPNLFATGSVVAGLQGHRASLQILVLVMLSLGALFLGMGHYLRFIW